MATRKYWHKNYGHTAKRISIEQRMAPMNCEPLFVFFNAMHKRLIHSFILFFLFSCHALLILNNNKLTIIMCLAGLFQVLRCRFPCEYWPHGEKEHTANTELYLIRFTWAGRGYFFFFFALCFPALVFFRKKKYWTGGRISRAVAKVTLRVVRWMNRINICSDTAKSYNIIICICYIFQRIRLILWANLYMSKKMHVIDIADGNGTAALAIPSPFRHSTISYVSRICAIFPCIYFINVMDVAMEAHNRH